MTFGQNNQALRSVRPPNKLWHTPVFSPSPMKCETFQTKNEYNSCSYNTQGVKYKTNRPEWQFLFFTQLCTVQCDFRVHDMDSTPAFQDIQGP